ncbi:response regulator [Paenibacillus sp. MSJ-34]|uniref:response regulator n=1 Tax=Paenibacillus sp. MSJ-34 TaxID=2841529 RepID=UPI001C127A92|nr:response regulator [Paenibacillus sp. MSJ-34]MBU5441229.1 response regulator [Paenibacillus sp. MSJ-34]
MQMYTLLIADDEPSTRTGLNDYFDWASCGITVIGTAEDGDSAYRLFVERQPSIILTDVLMPVMDGIALAGRIRENHSNVPIIFISGHDDIEYMKSALQMDAVDYILKPIQFAELANVMRKTVSRLQEADRRNELMAGMNARLSQSLPLLKEKFFSALIQDGAKSAVDLQRQLDFLDIGLPQTGLYCACIISVDQYSNRLGALSERDKQLISFALLNISQELIDAFRGGYAFEHRQGEFVCIVRMDMDEDEGALHSLAQRLQQTLSNLLKLSVTIGIGRSVTGLGQLPVSYAMAVNAVNQKLFLGSSSIIWMDSLQTGEESLFKLTQRESSAFVASLRAGDEEKTLSLLELIYQKLSQHPCMSRRQCQNLFLQLFLNSSNIRMELGLSSDETDKEESRFWEQMASLELAADMKELLAEHVRRICEAVRNKRNDRSSNVIEQTKAIIHNRFGENLTIQQIADEIYLTSTYLCLIFKQETGFTINEYLTHVRMENAKTMLRDPRHKMYDICYSVGYTDPSYFTKQFKKHTGYTPKEYREHAL